MPPMRPTPAAQPAPEARLCRVELRGVAVEHAPGPEVEERDEGAPQDELRPRSIGRQAAQPERERRERRAEQVHDERALAAPPLDEVGGGEVARHLREGCEEHEPEGAHEVPPRGGEYLRQPGEDPIVREHHPEPQDPQHQRPPRVRPGPQRPQPRARDGFYRLFLIQAVGLHAEPGGGLPSLGMTALAEQLARRLGQAAAQDEHVEGRKRTEEERGPPAVLRNDEEADEGGQDPTVSPEALQEHDHPAPLLGRRHLGDERAGHRQFSPKAKARNEA